jgi:threonine dehydratase
MYSLSLDKLQHAAETIAPYILKTPLIPNAMLCPGLDLHLKLENVQVTGSFKARGGLYKLLALSEKQRQRGVIAMSAGNHAQGVAYHAGRLQTPAVIVMPEGTPFNKVARTETLGAKVILHGKNVEESLAHCHTLAQAHGYTLVHPFDDDDIIAGQASVGLEILRDSPDVDTIITPIGGGGLAAGICCAVQAVAPHVRVIGVEVAGYASMRAKNTPYTDNDPNTATLADGIAVKKPGIRTAKILDHFMHSYMTVSETDVEQALMLLLERQRIVVEGAGATPLAAAMQYRQSLENQKVALVISGGNVDSRLLATILMRGLSRDGRIVRLRIQLPDRPGALAEVSQIIGKSGGNIMEIHHQRLFLDVPVKKAELEAMVETTDMAHTLQLVDALKKHGFATDLLDHHLHH